MADTDVIGYATLQVIPSLKGISGNLGSELGAPLVAAGKKAGNDTAAAIASGLKNAEAAAEKAAAAIEKARAKEADAAGKVNVAEAQLQALRDKGVTDVGRLAAAEEKVLKAKRDHETATRTVERAEKDHTRALKEVEAAANDTAEAVEDTGRRSLIAADNLAKFGAIAAAGVAAAGAALFKLGGDFADMSNNIRIGTGASGEAFDELVGIAKGLGSQVPASFEDIGSTVADLNTRLGLTGKPLETLSRQFLELNNMGIDTDINGIAASFQAFGVTGEDTAGALDELFQVSQATGLGVNELAAAAVKGGPALREFGFGLGESAALAGTLDKAGLDATSTFGAMQRAMVNFAKEGKSGEEALFGTVVEIENLIESGNDAAALDIAGKVFGTRGAAQFVDAIRLGTLSVDDFVSATGATEDTILGLADETRTFSDQWVMFKNEAMAGLEPIATRVFGVMTEGMTWIKDNAIPAFRDMATWIGENKPLLTDLGIALGVATTALTLFVAQQKIAAAGGFAKFITGIVTSTKAWTIAQTALNIALNMNPIGLIIGALAALAAGLVIAYRNSETFRNIVSAAWSGIQSAVSAAWEFVQPVFGFFADAGRKVGEAAMWLWNSAIVPAWQGISSVISEVWTNWISPVIENFQIAGRMLGDMATWLWQNAIVPAWSGISSAVQTAWSSTVEPVIGFVKGGFETAGNAATWLYENAIRPAWNGIQSAISSVWDFLQPIFGKIGDGMNGIGSIASSVAEGIRSAFAGVVDVLKAPVRYVGSLLTRIPAKVGPFNVPGAASLNEWGASLQALRSGGVVAGRRPDGLLYGPGTGTSDSILGMDAAGMPTALVSANEFVVNAKSTAENLPLLKMINAGWVPSAEFLRALVFEGDFRDTGVKIDESSDFVARALGLRSLIAEGDYTGNVYDGFGWDEDHPAVDAILTAREALSKLPKFADGGLVSANDLVEFAKGVEGQPYVWGGVNWGDCSGAVSALANYATGRAPFASRFATMTMKSELADRGFLPGLGPEGSLNVGWFNGGPYGGHTSATLPNGVNFEMGGARGDGQYGGMAAPADDPMYTDHAHLPPEFFTGGDLGSPTFGGSLGDGVSWSLGAGPGGASGASGGGAGIGGSSSSSGSGSGSTLGVVRTDATPVFVVNWPSGGAGSSFGGSSSGTASAGSSSSSTTALGGTPSESPDAPSFTRDDLTADLAGSDPKRTDAVFGKLEQFGISADKIGQIGEFGVKAGELAGQIGAAANGGPIDVDALRGNAADMLTLGGSILEPEQPLGGTGVDSAYGSGDSGDSGTDKWADWAKNAAGQWESFFKDNWREMLNTAVGVGLGGIGGGGGDTYNITGPDPNAVSRVISRHQRRKSIASQRIGGFGR